MEKTLSDDVRVADAEFRVKCKELDLEPWNVNPKLNGLYLMGVSLHCLDSDFDDQEALKIVEVASGVAEKYGLKPVCSEPTLTQGGYTVYVGFEK